MPCNTSLTLAIHQCNITGSGLVVKQRADLGSASVLVPPLDEELFGNLLIRDDDELLP